jgi:hypothetical protein
MRFRLARFEIGACVGFGTREWDGGVGRGWVDCELPTTLIGRRNRNRVLHFRTRHGLGSRTLERLRVRFFVAHSEYAGFGWSAASSLNCIRRSREPVA